MFCAVYWSAKHLFLYPDRKGDLTDLVCTSKLSANLGMSIMLCEEDANGKHASFSDVMTDVKTKALVNWKNILLRIM